MKKIKLLVLSLLVGFVAKAQIPVTDAAANTALTNSNIVNAKNLAESMAQTKTLYDSYTTLQKTVEIYKKVSSAIRNSERALTLIQNQFIFIEKAGLILNDISKTKMSLKSIKRANTNIARLITEGNYNVSLITQLLVDNKLMTDDGNRVMIIEQIAKAQRDLNAELSWYEHLYKFQDDTVEFYSFRKKRKK